VRQLLNVPATQNESNPADSLGDSEPQTLSQPCPCCGGRMIIIETFERGGAPRYRSGSTPHERNRALTR